MSGETDLDTLLRGLSADLVEGVFVFATLSQAEVPLGLAPRMMFQESEGITLILLKEQAEVHGLAYEFPCRMITLNVHSALAAVGFIARISTALADAGMGVNPVAGFYHDHLFVPEGREGDAMRVLENIAQAAR
ncbi:ACT domain-containing protein [Sulfitobacter aestuariivivens]|uniref:ACT domain-containing protein n=1 Tax=Sulfitobacter aestuariivivens TaxID=2766981 RepID=A0A927D6V0_9RHOB|nr:ACT domain-containing protein [Sulfitobacter aestuariivivens]MBD3665481.1 ACT domain-containing protein [Sulfitobacter aestuariivivens]